MHKLLSSILKILILITSININAEQELVEQNITLDSEAVEIQNEEEAILSSEDQASGDELGAEIQLNSDIESTFPVDVMLVLDNSRSMKKK